jgi:signal transduction histidine kinase
VQRFGSNRNPLDRENLDTLMGYGQTQPGENLWINELDIELFVPIHKKGEWIGLLALGPKLSGEPYWDDERYLLASVADQTAVALENTRLVESLMRLNNEFRRAINALNQANRNLERLDRTKTDFISIASHELLTPLTVISGYSQMLMEDPNLDSNPYYKKIIRGMHNGAQRLNEIVEGMLDLAKIDTQALSLDPKPVELAALLQELAQDLQASLAERRQRLETSRLEGLPPVEADRAALRKVFHHLVVNAIKYTPDGGRITIYGQAIPQAESGSPGGAVQVTVSDTGVGIDPAVQDLIFNKFYQTGELELHSTGRTKFKGGGPGLGLAIVKGIVEAHGGRVWMESPGYDENTCPGSQFHVLLPRRQVRAETPKIVVSP